MATRAVYVFVDDDNPDGVIVYKHHDGYVAGALHHIVSALPFAWPLPRFDACDFAAAFVAANISEVVRDTYPKIVQAAKAAGDKGSYKDKHLKVVVDVTLQDYQLRNCAGSVRLLPFGNGTTWADVAPWDIAYVHTISMQTIGKSSRHKGKKVPDLYVKCQRPIFDEAAEGFIGLAEPEWQGYVTPFAGKDFPFFVEMFDKGD